MNIKQKRDFGALVGRESLAVRALEIAQEIVDTGSYKRAIHGAGQLKVIAEACTFDEYWDEKASAGQYNEETRAKMLLNID